MAAGVGQGRPDSCQNLRNGMLVGVSYHPRHAAQSGNLCRRSLGVTTGNQDSASGVRAVDAADQLAHFGVCRRRNRTSVKHGDVALGGALRFPQTGVQQLPLQGCAVGLAGPASEIAEMKAGHGFDLANCDGREGSYQPSALSSQQGDVSAPIPSWLSTDGFSFSTTGNDCAPRVGAASRKPPVEPDYSGSCRVFLRSRFRARACFTRFFSPGFK